MGNFFSRHQGIFKILSIWILLILSYTLYAKSSDDIQQILSGINRFRLLHLLPPLKIDEQLNAIAATHSQNMAKHVCPIGHQGFEHRFAKIRQLKPNTMQASENVAYGYRNVDEVIKGWIHSPGHRANILGPFSITGIAIAHDANGKPYYTQLFARQGQVSIFRRR
jgi:uncharacterized protein YkwD